jgi:molybdate transport system permease protein
VSPITLSLWVASWATLIALLCGTLIAWGLVRIQFKGKWLLESLVMMPLALPPTVLGYYLLVLLGQRGLGPHIENLLGFRLVFSVWGAIVAGTIVALPLIVQAIQVSLSTINPEIEDAARIDGCTEWEMFWYISLPLSWRGILAGGTLGFLRVLGDFGTTLMVAGNIPGHTQTMPMAIYDAVQTNNIFLANELTVILSIVVFLLLLIILRLRQVD